MAFPHPLVLGASFEFLRAGRWLRLVGGGLVRVRGGCSGGWVGGGLVRVYVGWCSALGGCCSVGTDRALVGVGLGAAAEGPVVSSY